MLNYIHKWISIPLLKWITKLHQVTALKIEEKSKEKNIFLSRKEFIESYHKYNLPSPYPHLPRDEAISQYVDEVINRDIKPHKFARTYRAALQKN